VDETRIDEEIQSVFWETRQQGLVLLREDWKVQESGLPPLELLLGEEPVPFHLERPSPFEWAKRSGYYRHRQSLCFVLLPECIPQEEAGASSFFLAGDFNGWKPEIEGSRWQLHPEIVYGELCWVLKLPPHQFQEGQSFKYVSPQGHWSRLPDNCLQSAEAAPGISNFIYHPQRTGYQLFRFHIDGPFPLQRPMSLRRRHRKGSLPIDSSRVLLRMQSEQAMGVSFVGQEAQFRLFGPRLQKVELRLRDPHSELRLVCPMEQDEDGVWFGALDIPLEGFFYEYRIGQRRMDADGRETWEERTITDPHARALVGPQGPGIILPPQKFQLHQSAPFHPPAWEDLQIAEIHLRDLLAQAENFPAERRSSFAGFCEWLDDPHGYLRELGINAVELQPVAEYEYREAQDYAWGYMPRNFFSPCSAYASSPEEGSQVGEFQELVEKFHSLGMAVILDVVYNHLGSPNPYGIIDEDYYFRHAPDGSLLNFSGCGNDFRSESPMAQRAILDSLEHWVKAYGVDGFRFDLAELLGMDCLRAIEERLKALRPSLILIAEPWSFRGHIGHALRPTGFAAWNDEYRDFIAHYVWGNGNREGLDYFMGGSLKYRSRFPAQSVNYVSCHDDHSWIDRITEKANHDGRVPTPNDRRRTHLAIALLFASIGIPMFAAGQDFLHSKGGVRNTYQNPELNALDYRRARLFSGTREYFRQWLRHRQSPIGRLWRLPRRPSRHYIRSYPPLENNSACALLFNASGELGSEKLLFAINPHPEEARFDLGELGSLPLRPIADTERLDPAGLSHSLYLIADSILHLPPLSVGLWELGES
jgi:pullulanase/glycogen debranching enzyme